MAAQDYIETIVTLKGKRFLLRVETSDDAAAYAKYEALRNEIWGFPEDNLPGSRNLMCENFFHEGTALLIAAYEETGSGELTDDPARFVAFSYGFVGVKDKAIAFSRLENLRFYSQYLGIKESHRSFGLGLAIKEFQRQNVRDLFGISTITCTYDPLTAVNAWRNVRYFRMAVEAYRVATYGEYGGLLNRLDIPSDRFFMAWDLRKEIRKESEAQDSEFSSGRPVVTVDERLVRGRSGPVRLEVVGDVILNIDDDVVFVRIPRDFYFMLRETDVGDEAVRRIPLDWRLKTRQVFQTLLAGGYRVADFIRTRDEGGENFYVLKKGGDDDRNQP